MFGSIFPPAVADGAESMLIPLIKEKLIFLCIWLLKPWILARCEHEIGVDHKQKPERYDKDGLALEQIVVFVQQQNHNGLHNEVHQKARKPHSLCIDSFLPLFLQLCCFFHICDLIINAPLIQLLLKIILTSNKEHKV